MLDLALGGIMIVALLACGFRRFKKGIPIASSCSLAISAACHPLMEDRNATLLPVQYGVLTSEIGGVVSRVGFSSREVEPLVDGVVYGWPSHSTPRNSIVVKIGSHNGRLLCQHLSLRHSIEMVASIDSLKEGHVVEHQDMEEWAKVFLRSVHILGGMSTMRSSLGYLSQQVQSSWNRPPLGPFEPI